MNLSSNFNRLSFNKLPLLKQSQTTETKAKEEPVVVQKQQTEVPTPAKITANALDAEALQNMNFISTAKTVESKVAATKTGHLTEAEAKEQGYTIINTADDLVKLSKGELKGDKFILMNDIDMANVKDWQGINLSNAEFNGNGCTVKNLTGANGLFSVIKGDSTVKNVSLDGANLKSATHCGALANRISGNVTIENCDVTNSSIEMLAGKNADIGLLIGHAYAGESESASITGCHVSASQIINENANFNMDASVGGLIGGNGGNSISLSDCGFDGKIDIYVNKSNPVVVPHTTKVGGLMGSGSAKIENCSVTGELKGGILGAAVGDADKLDIKGFKSNATLQGLYIGGVLGQSYGKPCVLNIEDSELNNRFVDYTGKEITPSSECNKYVYAKSSGREYGKLVGITFNGVDLKQQGVSYGDNKPEEIQYKFPDLIDMKQDEKDMKDAAYKQGLTESPCSGVYSKQVRSGSGYKTVYYIWNSNDKEFERCNDIKSINADGSYVNNRGKTINKPANEQIAARVGGYTPTVEEGTYFKDGRYYNYDEDSNEFFEVDKSLYEVHDEDTTQTDGTKTDDTKTDGTSGGKTDILHRFTDVEVGTFPQWNREPGFTKIKLPYNFPLYKRFEQ